MLIHVDRIACRRHADALLEIVEGVDAGPASTAALDHLEWCRPCAAELQDLALALVAFRRLGEVPATAGPPASAWPRLRARLDRSRAAAAAVAWRWRATLAGVATAMLLVAATVGPQALQAPLGSGISEPSGLTRTQDEIRNREVENQYINRASSLRMPPDATIPSSLVVAGPRLYPDAIQPVRKEVPAPATGRPTQAD